MGFCHRLGNFYVHDWEFCAFNVRGSGLRKITGFFLRSSVDAVRTANLRIEEGTLAIMMFFRPNHRPRRLLFAGAFRCRSHFLFCSRKSSCSNISMLLTMT